MNTDDKQNNCKSEEPVPAETPAETAEIPAAAEQNGGLPENSGAPQDERSKDKRIMDDFARQVEERKNRDTKAKRRNWWIKTVLLIAIIGLSIGLLVPITKGLTGENPRGFTEMVQGASLPYFFLLIAAVIAYIVTDSFQYSYILKTSTGKFRIRNSLKVSLLGKYYDGVTPLGTGGQPFQIYYLHKKDIPAGIATAVPLVKYTFSTFAKGVLSVIFFSLAFKLLPGEILTDARFITIYVLAWVSMFLNMMIPVIMVFGSLFPRAGKKLIIRIINLLAKMHIVKRKYKVTKKYVTEMSEYRRALKEILTRWWIVVPLAFICIVTAVINFSLPFFTSVALVNVQPTIELWLQMLCAGLLAYYAASLIPTPGNSLAIDLTAGYTFLSVLQSLPGGEHGPVAFWVYLVWRLLTYYIFIFTGIGINIFEIIRSAVRNRRARNSQKQ